MGMSFSRGGGCDGVGGVILSGWKPRPMVINQERGNRTNPVMSSAVMSACSQGKKETIITVAIIVTIGTIYSALTLFQAQG